MIKYIETTKIIRGKYFRAINVFKINFALLIKIMYQNFCMNISRTNSSCFADQCCVDM